MKYCKSQYHVGNPYLEDSLFTSKYHKNTCKYCLSAIRKKEREKNKQRVQREQHEWRKANKNYLKQYNKEYRNSSHGHKIRYCSYERNREQKRTYDRERRQNIDGVRDLYNEAAARHRAACLQALPPWYEQEREHIKQVYEQRKQITEQTQVQHYVDHYYPLQGKEVCGLHCVANLRIISSTENISKSNKLPE